MRSAGPYRSGTAPRGRPCPRCRAHAAVMLPQPIGDTPTERCERCRGVWLAAADFNELLVNAQWQRDVLATSELAGGEADDPAPRFCPDCAAPLDRAQLGRTSGVEVDSCRRHGIWFDVGELRRAVGFLSDHVERADLDARIACALAELDEPRRGLRQRFASFLGDLLWLR